MSGYEPGRPKIEEREAHLIWNGTRMLDDNGVEWTLVQVRDFPEPDTLIFDVTRPGYCDGEPVSKFVKGSDLIRCRVEEEDR